MKKIYKIVFILLIAMLMVVFTTGKVAAADEGFLYDDSKEYVIIGATETEEGQYMTLRLITSDVAFVKLYNQEHKEIGAMQTQYEVISAKDKIIKIINQENQNVTFGRISDETNELYPVTNTEAQKYINEKNKEKTKEEIQGLSETSKQILEIVVALLGAAGVSVSTILLMLKSFIEKLKKNKDDLSIAQKALDESKEELAAVRKELKELHESIKDFKNAFQTSYENEQKKKKELNLLIAGELTNEK